MFAIESTISVILQGIIVLLMIALGVRTGGMGIGLWGGVGVLLLTVLFGLEPGTVPISAVFIILSVVTAAGAMQVAGGIDYMVSLAEKALRKRPSGITFMAPIISWLFTVGAGTGNAYYSILPVIYEVSYKNKVRPERPLSLSSVASQLGITSSPVSSAMAAMVGLMIPVGFQITDILMIVIPATLVGILITAFFMSRYGKELEKDPEFQRRLKAGEINEIEKDEKKELPAGAKLSSTIFLLGVLAIVVFGIFEGIRPHYNSGGEMVPVQMTELIQIIMFTVAVLIIAFAKANPREIPNSNIFDSGMVAVISLFGVAWMANTFIEAHKTLIENGLGAVVQQQPWFIAVALFIVAALTTSQTSATLSIIPIGLTLGIAPQFLIAMWPAVIGIYFFPANGGQIATAQIDQTGTTKIGHFVVNHSFMIPMLMSGFLTVLIGIGLAFLFFGA